METIVLVFPGPDVDLKTILAEIADWPTFDLPSGNCRGVEVAGEHLYLCVDDTEEEGLFEGWPPSLVPESATVVSVDYRDHVAVETLVRRLNSAFTFVIDTNFGDVLRGEAFVLALDENSRWEWWKWERDRAGGAADG
ncbi:hypothetical protein ACIBCL_23470 [Micromonospora zamorensis]|uniref:hypothetical protein n=1 Tax=Micromonospora zamorensis TaxID=709883 RepID=UPI0037B584E1